MMSPILHQWIVLRRLIVRRQFPGYLFTNSAATVWELYR